VDIEPFQQGDLDCLCGLYAVINSFRFSLRHCHPLRKQDCRVIYSELIHHLMEDKRLADALTWGLGTPEISRLLKITEEWLLEVKGITVKHHKPFHKASSVSFPQMLRKLSSHLATSDTAALVLAQGRIDHWTVVHSINHKSLNLFDSRGMHRFGLHSIHSAPPETSGKTLQIVPTGLFLIEAAVH
jgi:hypothetical protein